MKLFEVVKLRNEKEQTLGACTKTYEMCKNNLLSEISELKRLESIASKNIDIEKIQVAENIMDIYGNIYGRTSDVIKFNGITLAEEAIVDIANNCEKLKKLYFGNKHYEAFYQRSDHPYGYGPKHGSIIDEVGLKENYRKVDLSDEEKDSCIYYLKNYNEIKEAKHE